MKVNRTIIVLAEVIAIFIATVSSSSSIYVGAQATATFSPTDRFAIPQLNGSLSFACNGSYSSAKLENDTWVFNDLVLNNSQRLGNLRVSVQNSNITIYSFYSSNAVSTTRHSVRYYAEGAGRQVFNLGVNGTTQPSEWWVTINVPNTVFLAQGTDWQLLPDNTVIVNGQTGNITVAHYTYGVSTDNSNVPFLERHSVLLVTVALVAVTVVVAAVITVKVRRKPRGN